MRIKKNKQSQEITKKRQGEPVRLGEFILDGVAMKVELKKGALQDQIILSKGYQLKKCKPRLSQQAIMESGGIKLKN